MFKLVCGAGNEDAESVKRLVFVYSKAGCKFFDISARKEVLNAAKEGAKIAGAVNVRYCVSVGIKGDPHISKAFINEEKCTKCGKCVDICPNDAVKKPPLIYEEKCIGCSKCEKVCPENAVKMRDKDVDISRILPEMIKDGVSVIELHVMGHDDADLEKKMENYKRLQPKVRIHLH